MTQTDDTVQDITTTAGPSAEYTAADISVLEGMDAVRKRPGMYVQGGTGIDGYHQLLTEIIDNGIDEGLAGFADEIHIILHADGAATVTGSDTTITGTVPPATRWPSGCRFRDRCPSAMARCAEDAPALTTITPGHTARCHLVVAAS